MPPSSRPCLWAPRRSINSGKITRFPPSPRSPSHGRALSRGSSRKTKTRPRPPLKLPRSRTRRSTRFSRSTCRTGFHGPSLSPAHPLPPRISASMPKAARLLPLPTCRPGYRPCGRWRQSYRTPLRARSTSLPSARVHWPGCGGSSPSRRSVRRAGPSPSRSNCRPRRSSRPAPRFSNSFC